MSSKRNLFLGIILSLVIVTLMTFSLTFARYSGDGKQEGTFSGEMDYIVSNQILIGSVDEFLTAIENGYTNIKIDDDVDNPLVITGGISDVNSDLTIDLNGHELQRNNRDPLLKILSGAFCGFRAERSPLRTAFLRAARATDSAASMMRTDIATIGNMPHCRTESTRRRPARA